MTTVFVGGSRRITRLGTDVRARLDRIVSGRLPVLIGDANGADKAVQGYLSGLGYEEVEVFCSERPRNNLGGWPVRVIQPSRATRDIEYYAAKDRAMAAEATVGLMLWDGESRGTLLNVLRLVALSKPVVVFRQHHRDFVEVRSRREFDRLVSTLPAPAARRFVEQAATEGLVTAVSAQQSLDV